MAYQYCDMTSFGGINLFSSLLILGLIGVLTYLATRKKSK